VGSPEVALAATQGSALGLGDLAARRSLSGGCGGGAV